MAQSEAQKKAAAKARSKQADRASSPKERNDAARDQIGALQGALFNIRQMYDQKVMEVDQLRQALVGRDQMLAAVVASSRGKAVKVKKSALESVLSGYYAGLSIDPIEDSEDLNITLVVSEDEEEEDPI